MQYAKIEMKEPGFSFSFNSYTLSLYYFSWF